MAALWQAVGQAQRKGLPWDEAISGAPEREAGLLTELRQRCEEGGVRLVLAAGCLEPRADRAWIAGHGEAWADIVVMVHVAAAEAIRDYLLPKMEEW